MKTNSHHRSPALRQARLKSERLRILILMGVAAVLLVLRTSLTLIFPSRENFHLWMLSSSLIACFFAFEFVMFRAVTKSLARGTDLPKSAWIVSTLLETCTVAFSVALLPSSSIALVYKPLANPSVLLFFLFIILSTLRLEPVLCRLSGLAAALSYLAAAVYLGWTPVDAAKTVALSPQKLVFLYSFVLFFAGIIAAAVAGEIRKHVDAALREADARREVERLEHDLDVARGIQQSLLPTEMPRVAGFDIAAWNQPADQTGGDYYDWQPLPDGKVLVALADVTGHGIGPALLAAVCRAYARTNFTADHGLFTAMSRINASLSADLKEGRFVTFVAAICGPGSANVELLSAGHGPLFVYTLGQDRFDAMNAHGMPLGISSSLISDPPQVLALSAGDLLILATDGFFEWENAAGEQFGVERLEATIRATRSKSAAEIIAELYSAVTAFSAGTPQKDDLTAVIIKKI
ncbi:MAG TPA: PP2C family protein-serine/threonine phosphatase [Candidatus Acidoferrales bacterium]